MKTDLNKTALKKKSVAVGAGDHTYTPWNKVKDDNGKLVVNHRAVARKMVRFIRQVKMPEFIKDILTYRILGCEPNYQPMTHMQIALLVGMLEEEVKNFEKEGMEICEDALHKVTLEESDEKYIQNSRISRDLGNTLSNLGNKPT